MYYHLTTLRLLSYVVNFSSGIHLLSDNYDLCKLSFYVKKENNKPNGLWHLRISAFNLIQFVPGKSPSLSFRPAMQSFL